MIAVSDGETLSRGTRIRSLVDPSLSDDAGWSWRGNDPTHSLSDGVSAARGRMGEACQDISGCETADWGSGEGVLVGVWRGSGIDLTRAGSGGMSSWSLTRNDPGTSVCDDSSMV